MDVCGCHGLELGDEFSPGVSNLFSTSNINETEQGLLEEAIELDVFWTPDTCTPHKPPICNLIRFLDKLHKERVAHDSKANKALVLDLWVDTERLLAERVKEEGEFWESMPPIDDVD